MNRALEAKMGESGRPRAGRSGRWRWHAGLLAIGLALLSPAAAASDTAGRALRPIHLRCPKGGDGFVDLSLEAADRTIVTISLYRVGGKADHLVVIEGDDVTDSTLVNIRRDVLVRSEETTVLWALARADEALRLACRGTASVKRAFWSARTVRPAVAGVRP